jgi:hypothetical protein
MGTGWSWLRIACGYGEGLLGSINAGNFLSGCKVYC